MNTHTHFWLLNKKIFREALTAASIMGRGGDYPLPTSSPVHSHPQTHRSLNTPSWWLRNNESDIAILIFQHRYRY